jgi:hypothetical protein
MFYYLLNPSPHHKPSPISLQDGESKYYEEMANDLVDRLNEANQEIDKLDEEKVTLCTSMYSARSTKHRQEEHSSLIDSNLL